MATNLVANFVRSLRKQKLHLRTFVQKQFNINKTVEKINKLNEEEDEEDEEMDCSSAVDEPKQADQQNASHPNADEEPPAKESDNASTEEHK